MTKFLVTVMALVLTALPVQATAQSSSDVDLSAISFAAKPDASALPALKVFRERGGSFHYMGRTAGLDGWFVILPDKFVQIAYTSLDGSDLIVGFITNAKGQNITEQQMVLLRERDPDVNKLFTDRVEDAKARLSQNRGIQEMAANLNPDKPGDRMYMELAQANNIEMGAKNAPLLLMVIDPLCPYCKAAWQTLAAKYLDKVTVRIIPVSITGPDSLPMAQRLLDKPNDTALWQQYAASNFDKTVLAGTPTAVGETRYGLNAGLYNRWKVKGTPFFAYRAKDGSIKVLNEIPKNWDAMIADIAPAPPAQ